MSEERYQPDNGCAATAERRGDSLMASAPPAERWLLIESQTPWPQNALSILKPEPVKARETNGPEGAEGSAGARGLEAMRGTRGSKGADGPAGRDGRRGSDGTSGPGGRDGRLGSDGTSGPGGRDGRLGSDGASGPGGRNASDGAAGATRSELPIGPGGASSLGAEVARVCRQVGVRPVLVRRYGRGDRSSGRRWGLVDSRGGRESIRWGELAADEELLDVLAGRVEGEVSSEPVYLVCTHGRHDACCAVRGRPAAAALAAAYPNRTWECSHVGGDRFAANVVLLPHSLFYGHVPQSHAVALAAQYDEGFVVPEYYRGSGAVPAPVQAAQHFARSVGHSRAIDALRPLSVLQSAPARWQVTLAGPDNRPLPVEVASHMLTVDARMTCAAQPPGQLRQFTLESPLPRA